MDYESTIKRAGYSGSLGYFVRFVAPLMILVIVLFVSSLGLIIVYGPMLNLGSFLPVLTFIPFLLIIGGVALTMYYPFHKVRRMEGR